MPKNITLEDIFNDDEFGILDTKPKNTNQKTEEERLVASFEEITDFFNKNNREPEATNVTEFKLFTRLKALRNDVKKIALLKPYDSHNLLALSQEKTDIKSVEDILKDDILGILDTQEALSIFELKHIKSASERAEADFTAKRKAMKDKEFAPFQEKFKKVHQELRAGKRKLVSFSHEDLKVNEYYINNGVLLFLEDVIWEKEIQKFKSGVHNRPDGRTKTIFENGTQSDMMFQSLYKALHFNGQMVTNTDENAEEELFKNANIVNEEDTVTGWVYVLRSKSTNPAIASINNLYKIGYSTVPVQERIKNAAKEATYLMADVHLLDKYVCYNMDAQKFEKLLHRFFAEVCLNIDIYNDKGRRISPREWFVAPRPIVDKVVGLLLSGDIVNYKYDAVNQALIEK